VALNETRHFGQAAAASFVSQSAFSNAISELETLLDAQLVDRTNRQVTITHTGQEIAVQARLVLRDLESLVEIASGEVTVPRVVCAVDAGFAIHPDGVAAQMESGIVYGLTAALYGEIAIRRGAVAQSNFHDYPMLRIDKAPAVETHIVNSGEALGGAGEPATPPIAPALTNAIYDATGIRIRELPVRLHDLSRPDRSETDVA